MCVHLPSLGCCRAVHCMLGGVASSPAAEQPRVVTSLREISFLIYLDTDLVLNAGAGCTASRLLEGQGEGCSDGVALLFT